jgi:hypothetical protein
MWLCRGLPIPRVKPFQSPAQDSRPAPILAPSAPRSASTHLVRFNLACRPEPYMLSTQYVRANLLLFTMSQAATSLAPALTSEQTGPLKRWSFGETLVASYKATYVPDRAACNIAAASCWYTGRAAH